MTGARAFTLVPAGAKVLGTGIAVWRPPGGVSFAILQHPAASLVFVAVALIYPGSEALLLEAHDGGPVAPWIAAMFPVCFLALLALDEVLG